MATGTLAAEQRKARKALPVAPASFLHKAPRKAAER
jgi:hypothetical protein